MSHVLWTHHARTDNLTTVFPDGCRDLLLVTPPDGRHRLMLTDWDRGPRDVAVQAGTQFVGYRLQPGVRIDMADLPALADLGDGAATALHCFVVAMTGTDPELAGIIDSLSLSADEGLGTARQAGVSQRTLQRHFKRLDMPPPDFWRLLGRARRAVPLLAAGLPLVDIAYGLGYSDQAHMTRELVRWFGRTPARLRRDPAALSVLAQPGLGTWMGEHSSIR